MVLLRNNKILNIGLIIGTLLLIIFSSGCTSSSMTKKFNDGAMSFSYPNDFQEISSHENKSSNTRWQYIIKLVNNNPLNIQVILVDKNTSNTSPSESRDYGVLKVKNLSTSEILSISTEINPNGVVVEKSTYKQKGLFGSLAIYNDMFFKIDDVVYAVSIYGPDSNKQQINNTANIVFKSIK